MATAEELLADIADYADIDPFPWAAYEASGKGVAFSDAYLDLLEERFNEYFKAVWTLDIPELDFGGVDADAALGAYDAVRGALLERASSILPALEAGKIALAAELAVEFPKDALRLFLVGMNTVAWASFSAHDEGAWRWRLQNGQASPAEVRESADHIWRMWGGFLKLYNAGLFDTFKKPQFKAASGLGAPVPVIPIIVAIVVVAALAIFAWVMVTMKVESNRIALIEKSCFDAKGRPLVPMPPYCQKYFDSIAKDPNAHLKLFLEPIGQALTAAATSFFGMVGLGVLIYIGGVHVLPAVLDTLSTRRARGGTKATRGLITQKVES